MTHPATIVFTDLDGTLLDHESYSAAAAAPALARLTQANIPVILASSKTAVEMIAIRETLGLAQYPAIVENGAGRLPAHQNTETPSGDYQKLRQILSGLDPQLRRGFTGFGDWDTAEIAKQTGLAPDQAELAGQRQFSEPGLWHGTADALSRFLATLSAKGVCARQGGRFLTLSFGASKADQMATLCAAYGAVRSIALGDAPNDIEMLQAADIAVVIANPHHASLPPLPREPDPCVLRPAAAGPAGWNDAIFQILDADGPST